jgi:hypothetical protein
MYMRKSFKKQKYLIVKLFSTSASKRSLYLYRCRCSGCINRWDVLITTYVIVWLAFHQTDAHYEVAIDTVSGDLDPTRGGLSFNLTLGVGSRSYVVKACIQPGCPTRMWRLPTAAPGSPRVRPRWGGVPRKTTERRVIARHVLDNLSADMSKGCRCSMSSYTSRRAYGSAADGQSWVTECNGR